MTEVDDGLFVKIEGNEVDGYKLTLRGPGATGYPVDVRKCKFFPSNPQTIGHARSLAKTAIKNERTRRRTQITETVR